MRYGTGSYLAVGLLVFFSTGVYAPATGPQLWLSTTSTPGTTTTVPYRYIEFLVFTPSPLIAMMSESEKRGSRGRFWGVLVVASFVRMRRRRGASERHFVDRTTARQYALDDSFDGVEYAWKYR